MTDSFFVPDGDRFVSTPWTQGPWDQGAQHAGPPSALLGRAFERLEPAGELRVARITVEILRPIPVAPLRIGARVSRPGKRVQFAEAAMLDGETVVARASAWRIRPSDEPIPEAGIDGGRPAGPEGIEPFAPQGGWHSPGYMAAMEWRFASGAFFEPGPAAAWMRMRIPLIPEETPSGTVRALATADSGNGISQVVPMRNYLFLNTELSVHLFREPSGEWICMDAVTRVGREGVGLAESTLWDATGRVGGGRQALLVALR